MLYGQVSPHNAWCMLNTDCLINTDTRTSRSPERWKPILLKQKSTKHIKCFAMHATNDQQTSYYSETKRNPIRFLAMSTKISIQSFSKWRSLHATSSVITHFLQLTVLNRLSSDILRGLAGRHLLPADKDNNAWQSLTKGWQEAGRLWGTNQSGDFFPYYLSPSSY